MNYWEKAIAAERAALGWEADAQHYLGERRQVRLAKADRMRGISERFMQLACE